MHFGVIGSGVVGLTTALALQKEYPTAQVTIITAADDVITNDTSSIAAELFRPTFTLSDTSEDTTKYALIY